MEEDHVHLELNSDLSWLDNNDAAPIKDIQADDEPSLRVTFGALTESSSGTLRRRGGSSNVSEAGGMGPQSTQFLDSLHGTILDWFPTLHIRSREQLYFNMIKSNLILRATHSVPNAISPSVLSQMFSSESTTTSQIIHCPVYWIHNDHLYWQIIRANWGDAAILSQLKTGQDSGFLAISQEYMDSIVDFVWTQMHDAGKFKIFSIDD